MQKVRAGIFADWIADKVRIPAIPYVEGGITENGTDCINLIRWALWELTGVMYERGSNSAWRKDMIWHGTIAEAKAAGYLIPGAIVYICDPPTSKWPDGDYGHSGVYVGFDYGLVSPEGKPADVVHASYSRDGVFGSILGKNAWTHVALHIGVLYALAGIDADEEEEIDTGEDDFGQADTDEGTSAETGGGRPIIEPKPGQAKVTTDGGTLTLRKSTKIDKKNVIRSMANGVIVDVLDQFGNDWTKVRFINSDGVEHIGWCATEYLRFG